MANTYYVDASGGSDANDGLTTSTAIQTLDNLAFIGGGSGAGTADDETIYLSGTFRPNWLTGVINALKIGGSAPPGARLTVKQWAGMPQAIIRGDYVIPLASWTGAAGVFTYSVPAGTCHYTNDSFAQKGCTLLEGIATVVVNWDASIDASGRHYGHLTRAQSAADCATRTNSWWFEPTGVRGNTQATGGQNGAGTLTINLVEAYANNAALQASGLTIAACVGNYNGVEIGTQRYKDSVYTQGTPVADNPNGTQSLTIDGIYVYLWADSGWRSQYGKGGVGVDVHATQYFYNTNSMGYNIRPSDCVNSTVKNCVIIDSGYHGIMFVGGRCNGNTMQNCTLWGGAPNPISANSIGGAFYTSGPTATGGSWNHNIFGCRANGVTVYGYTHLGRSGDPIAFPFNNAVTTTLAPSAVYVTELAAHGFISHTNNEAGNRITDVEYNDCYFYNSGKLSDGTNCIGDGFSTSEVNTGTGATATPSTPLVASAYPVRFNNCVVSGGAKNHLSGDLSASFSRCQFILSRHGTAAVAANTGAVGSGSGTHTILYDACTFVDTMGHATDDRYTIQGSSTNTIYLVNCSFYGLGTAANKKAFLNFQANTSRIKAYGCIFFFKTDVGDTPSIVITQFGWNVADFNETLCDVQDCIIGGPVAFVPAGPPGPNTVASWKTGWNSVGIDQAAVDNGTTNPYADVTGATLSLTEAAKAQRKFLSTYASSGVNGMGYAGNYGAWQYPTGGNMFEHMMRMRQRRLRRKREQAAMEDDGDPSPPPPQQEVP